MSQMIQYIDYDKIKDSKDGTVKVKCYNNGNKWMCPNPKNEDFCYMMENWYSSTHNIEYKEIYITEELYLECVGNVS